jgi:hypothetical protein
MTDDGGTGWLALQCPHCRARLRLKEAYAHLRGRCPECSYRIDAPRPAPRSAAPPPAPVDFDEDSPRLEPMEEEWPEPAQLEGEETSAGGTYDMTATPKRWAESPSPEPAPPRVEGYEVADGWTEAAPVPAPDLPDGYDVGAVPEARAREEEPVLYRLSRAERAPLREPPPPEYPLFEGIYLFPWQSPANVRVWLLMSFGISCVLLLGAAVLHFTELLQAGDHTGAFVIFPLAAALIIGLITGAYVGSVFLASVQDTAAGNRDVRWPDDAFMGRFAQFGYLLWLFACAAWPTGIALMIEPAWLQRLKVAVPLALLPILLFPIFMLSSLAAQKTWVLLYGRLLLRLAQHLFALIVIWLVSTVLVVGVGALTYFNVAEYLLWLTPLTASAWAASLLVYSRLLGRLAWLCARKAPAPDARRPRRAREE